MKHFFRPNCTAPRPCQSAPHADFDKILVVYERVYEYNRKEFELYRGEISSGEYLPEWDIWVY